METLKKISLFVNLGFLFLFIILGLLLFERSTTLSLKNGDVQIIKKLEKDGQTTVNTVYSAPGIVSTVPVHQGKSYMLVVWQNDIEKTLMVSESDFNKVNENDILRYEDGKLYIK